MALGADGVQIGSRFAVTRESSGHDAFKQAVVDAYSPLLEGRTLPDSVGELILDDSNAGDQNVAVGFVGWVHGG